jgi:hypothetical protein
MRAQPRDLDEPHEPDAIDHAIERRRFELLHTEWADAGRLIDPVEEIKFLFRTLTYEQMMTAAGGIGIEPGKLHAWAIA